MKRRQFLICLAGACGAAASSHQVKSVWQWPAMGTTFRLILGSEADDSLKAKLRAEVERLEQIFSVHRPDSEVHEFMRLANSQPGAFHPVSSDLFELLKLSEEISTITAGAFDVTIGSLTNYWRYCAASGTQPVAEKLALLKKRTGRGQIQFEAERVAFTPKDKSVLLDFGGIGKGYTADKILKLLNTFKIENCLIEFGGELLAGKGNWPVTLLNESGQVAETLSLSETALSTSGDLHQRTAQGWSHVISHQSPEKEESLMSVTLEAKTSAWADALATAYRVNPAAAWLSQYTTRHWSFGR